MPDWSNKSLWFVVLALFPTLIDPQLMHVRGLSGLWGLQTVMVVATTVVLGLAQVAGEDTPHFQPRAVRLVGDDVCTGLGILGIALYGFLPLPSSLFPVPAPTPVPCPIHTIRTLRRTEATRLRPTFGHWCLEHLFSATKLFEAV